jgi:hypothetical protein
VKSIAAGIRRRCAGRAAIADALGGRWEAHTWTRCAGGGAGGLDDRGRGSRRALAAIGGHPADAHGGLACGRDVRVAPRCWL